jgi:glycosyltransferase involved in cell wall biosynthesis
VRSPGARGTDSLGLGVRSTLYSISCAILCHNYGRYLREAIASCLDQEDGSFVSETIVLDDGSTDETAEVCRAFGDAIRVSRTERLGFGGTLERAIRESQGEYVAFLDADDRFLPMKMKRVSEAIDSATLLLTHSAFEVDEAGRRTGAVLAGGSTSTLVVHRRSAEDILPVENGVFFHALDQPGNSIVLPDLLSEYRRHPLSMQSDPRPGEWHETLAETHSRYAVRLLQLASSPPVWLRSARDMRERAERAREVAAFCSLESALEKGLRGTALRRLATYISRLGPKGLVRDTRGWKMIARALVCRPVYQRRWQP